MAEAQNQRAQQQKAAEKNGPSAAAGGKPVDEFDIPEDKDAGKFEKLVTSIEYFWAPMIEIERAGGLIERKLCRIRGIIVGARRRPKREDRPELGGTVYYLVKATAPHLVRDNDKKPKRVEAGALIWVDERYDFRQLRKALPSTDEQGNNIMWEVRYEPKYSKDIGGGRSKWEGELGVYQLDAEQLKAYGFANKNSFASFRPQLQSGPVAPPVEGELEDDQIPF